MKLQTQLTGKLTTVIADENGNVLYSIELENLQASFSVTNIVKSGFSIAELIKAGMNNLQDKR